MMREQETTSQPSGSSRPDKPARPPRSPSGVSEGAGEEVETKVTILTSQDMVVETCSCGSSIAMPHFFTDQEQARQLWRDEHKCPDFPFARACPDPSVHPEDLVRWWQNLTRQE